ncbi:hypothetical protein OXB_3181 [Bacillus sp. OxB-1]|uniref:FAS1-like dehydratase domain-containing protein n=1 Tax=Bacillus sp. (strain OxB-1) TaxID=98228 RepID=UPI0005823288|nr:MaoC family dehydratase N-terminal domain-containing protein [Bacillus sp. OxB-1]BAQ11650.1 hypothetical protein OXB_3181 [Bacillus sp. OxB-1]
MTNKAANKVGVTIGSLQFMVERGKIKEFALAIGDDNPLYYDVETARAAGFRDVPIPPTFPTVIEMWGGLDFEALFEVLEMNPLKVLHGEQEYTYLQDICAGDEITGEIRVKADEVKRAMRLVTLEGKFMNQQMEDVLLSKSVVIERM